jgi:hypothetical protein
MNTQELDMNNLNQYKFMSLVPMSAIDVANINLELGDIIDIEFIGKGAIGRGFRQILDLAYQVSTDKKQLLIVNLKKGEPYIKILKRN